MYFSKMVVFTTIKAKRLTMTLQMSPHFKQSPVAKLYPGKYKLR